MTFCRAAHVSCLCFHIFPASLQASKKKCQKHSALFSNCSKPDKALLMSIGARSADGCGPLRCPPQCQEKKSSSRKKSLWGTVDVVRQYFWLFEEHSIMEFLILAGDYLYRMDYQKFIQTHRETNADITVAALPIDEKWATTFGLMKIDSEGHIVKFAEKPKGE